MKYLPLGFSIASFLAAGAIALTTSAEAGLQPAGAERTPPTEVCRSTSNQACGRPPADSGDRYGGGDNRATASAPQNAAPITPIASTPAPTRARVTKGSGSLPSDAGSAGLFSRIDDRDACATSINLSASQMPTRSLHRFGKANLNPHRDRSGTRSVRTSNGKPM